MNKISTPLAALLMMASIGASAQTTTDTTRDQRMNAALQDYRGGGNTSRDASTGNSSGNGRFARTEDSVKSGTRKTGHTIADGARSAGHAVAQGARKTGHAIHNATTQGTGKAKNAADNTAP